MTQRLLTTGFFFWWQFSFSSESRFIVSDKLFLLEQSRKEIHQLLSIGESDLFDGSCLVNLLPDILETHEHPNIRGGVLLEDGVPGVLGQKLTDVMSAAVVEERGLQ